MLNTNIKQFNTFFKTYYTILQVTNFLLTFIFCLIILLSSNIRIYFYSKEIYSNSIMLIAFLIFILGWAIYFLTFTLNVNLLGILYITILSFSTFLILYKMTLWFTNTIEGTFSFKFLTIIKTASYDIKLNAYHEAVNQTINILCQKNENMKTYISNLPFIKNPVFNISLNTKYHDIVSLAETKVQKGYQNYLDLQKTLNDSKSFLESFIILQKHILIFLLQD